MFAALSLLNKQGAELGFAEDVQAMTLGNQVISAAMFAAFLVVGENRKVAVTDHQQGDRPGHCGFDRDSGTRRQIHGFGPWRRKSPGKARDMAKKWTVRVDRWRDRRCARRWFGHQVGKGLPGLPLSLPNHHRGGFGILSGVMMFKIKAKKPLEIAKPMTTIAAQLWPGTPGNRNAVVPGGVKVGQAVSLTGAVDRPFVKIAVLHQRMALQERAQRCDHIGENGVALNRLCADPVQLRVKRGKVHFRVDKIADRVQLGVIGGQCQPKLANAGPVRIGGFNVDSHKTIGFVQYLPDQRRISVQVRRPVIRNRISDKAQRHTSPWVRQNSCPDLAAPAAQLNAERGAA